MKRFIPVLFSCICFVARAQTPTLAPGQPAPAIALKNVDDKTVSFADYPAAKGFIVVFTCNTCPYAKAYEQRIGALAKKYTPLGFPLLAINPNDPQASPGDSFSNMKARAKAAHYTFPYLYDAGQAVTAAYGARSTPHVFIIVKGPSGATIAYTGAIDSDTQNTDPSKITYVENALSALLQQQRPTPPATKAIGCAVRWKK